MPKVNQVTYTFETICKPNIMTLAQAVLEIFCSQGSIDFQWESRKNVEKGLQLTKKKKKICVRLIFVLIPHIKFQDHISKGS